MIKTFTVNLEKPITSAKFLDGTANEVGSGLPDIAQGNIQDKIGQIPIDSTTQINELLQACQAIKVFANQKEEIARLSVEIARKVLMKKVEDGDYKIETIIKEALNNAPTRHDVVVHLNPKDLEECQKVQQNNPGSVMAGVKFVSDSNMGRAECLLESPKGRLESLINEHLDRISKALIKME